MSRASRARITFSVRGGCGPPAFAGGPSLRSLRSLSVLLSQQALHPLGACFGGERRIRLSAPSCFALDVAVRRLRSCGCRSTPAGADRRRRPSPCPTRRRHRAASWLVRALVAAGLAVRLLRVVVRLAVRLRGACRSSRRSRSRHRMRRVAADTLLRLLVRLAGLVHVPGPRVARAVRVRLLDAARTRSGSATQTGTYRVHRQRLLRLRLRVRALRRAVRVRRRPATA